MKMLALSEGRNDPISSLQITFVSFPNNDACLLAQADIATSRFSHRFEYLISVLVRSSSNVEIARAWRFVRWYPLSSKLSSKESHI